MGRHRKHPGKGNVVKDNRQKKFRPQDPCSKHSEALKPGRNAPPKADKDAIGIPRMAGRALMPVLQGSGPSGTGEDKPSGRQQRRAKQKDQRTADREERGPRSGGARALSQSAATAAALARAMRELGCEDDDGGLAGPPGSGSEGADSDAGSSETGTLAVGGGAAAKIRKRPAASARSMPPSAPSAAASSTASAKKELPRQRPAESAKAFSARVDQTLKEQLQQASKKVNTEHAREKKRMRAAEKKKRARERKGKAKADERAKKSEKVAFGDVAQRPPKLSSAVMQSRAKLKKKGGEAAAKVAVPGAGLLKDPSAPVGASAVPSNLEDYAAKVKEAYAAIKKRRLGGGAI